jgi:hypothetical protein
VLGGGGLQHALGLAERLRCLPLVSLVCLALVVQPLLLLPRGA